MNRSTQKRNNYIRGYPVASAAKTPPIIAPGILCPKCKGQMLDERQSKRSEKSPDYVCSNMLCTDASGKYRTAIWEKDANRNGSAGGAQPAVNAVVPPADSERPKLSELYGAATQFVLDKIVPLYVEKDIGVSDQAVASMVATLFIAVAKEKRGGN